MKPLNRLQGLNRQNAFLTGLCFIIGTTAVLLLCPPASAAEPTDTTGQSVNFPKSVHRIFWDESPVPVTLVVGVERRVGFKGEVRVGMPVEIQPSVRTQSTGGAVYWLANEPFTAARVQIQIIETGEIVLIDLTAVKKPKQSHKTQPASPAVPIEIVTGTDAASPPANTGEDTEQPSKTEPDYVTLTRYAAQQLYAPKRLLNAPEGVYRASVLRAPVPRGPVTLVRGQPVEAVPVAAWRGGHLHVTAVRLRNLGPAPVILDPRTLRGSWLTATFQHARLHPAGSDADTTAVYLISARPFEESL